jgi:hypothetical protein
VLTEAVDVKFDVAGWWWSWLARWAGAAVGGADDVASRPSVFASIPDDWVSSEPRASITRISSVPAGDGVGRNLQQ